MNPTSHLKAMIGLLSAGGGHWFPRCFGAVPATVEDKPPFRVAFLFLEFLSPLAIKSKINLGN